MSPPWRHLLHTGAWAGFLHSPPPDILQTVPPDVLQAVARHLAECCQEVLTCLPSCRLRQLTAQGTIGEVQHFQGTFVAHIGGETPRLYDLNLGGGALLDIGVSSGVLQLCTVIVCVRPD